MALFVVFFTGYVAGKKGYSGELWVLWDFLFNIIALIAIAGLPKK